MNQKNVIIFLFVLINLNSHWLNSELLPQIIIWNVGQGQWITYIKNNNCYHMDFGGEYYPKLLLAKKCKSKKNWLFNSHADKDHINFVFSLKNILPDHCFISPTKKLIKYARIKKHKICQLSKKSPIKIIYKPKKSKAKNRNELSRVYLIEGKVLNPGDSLKVNELYWAQKKELNKVRTLILGHHGSITSNSDFLLQKLPQLKYSVASARKSRYGHPHGKVKLRLKLNKSPVLSTENWSHIIIYL